MKKTETLQQCQGCKFNIQFGENECVCPIQQMILKGSLEVETCDNKQERVRVAC